MKLVDESTEAISDENVLSSEESVEESLVSDESLETASDNSSVALSSLAKTLNLQASAYDGSISTTYTTYFAGVVDKLSVEDYVLIRSGQYEYTFAYGDLDLNGTTFTGSGRVVQIDTYRDTVISSFDDDNITISVGSRMAYSNLGEYPALAVGTSKAQLTDLIWLVIVVSLVAMISSWFGYGLGGWRIWRRSKS